MLNLPTTSCCRGVFSDSAIVLIESVHIRPSTLIHNLMRCTYTALSAHNWGKYTSSGMCSKAFCIKSCKFLEPGYKLGYSRLLLLVFLLCNEEITALVLAILSEQHVVRIYKCAICKCWHIFKHQELDFFI